MSFENSADCSTVSNSGPGQSENEDLAHTSGQISHSNTTTELCPTLPALTLPPPSSPSTASQYAYQEASMASSSKPILKSHDSGESTSSNCSTESEIHVGSFVDSFRGSISGMVGGGGGGSFSSRGISFSAGSSSPILGTVVSHFVKKVDDKAGNDQQEAPVPAQSRKTYGTTLTWGPESEDRRYRYQRQPQVIEDDEEAGITTGLLGDGLQAVDGVLSWPREIFFLMVNSAPLMTSFLLQYSLTLISVLSVGYLGVNELAAVSLATMTANVTGYGIYNAFATTLDTLCAQSYAAERYTHLGLHLQRCIILLMLVTIPIGAIWNNSEYLLGLIIPNKQLAELAGTYLQILYLGLPGHALFEAGKTYLQAQGNHQAPTVVLGLLAPFNAAINYLLVWDTFFGIGIGFKGAPMAIVITNWLMSICLALYIIFKDDGKCWHPLTFRAFTNWQPILKLAVPQIVMRVLDFLTVELLTLFSSFLGASTTAAQSVLATIMGFLYQLPFAMAISSCASVEQYIASGDASAARLAALIGIAIALALAAVNGVILLSMKGYIGIIFSSDETVIATVSQTIPIFAIFQAADVLSSVTGGILRGQGRQHIVAMLQAPTHYVLAMPINLYTSFVLEWGLKGMWTGSTIASVIIAGVQTLAVLLANWDDVIRKAGERAAAGLPDGISAE